MKYVPYAIIALLVVALIVVINKGRARLPDNQQAVIDSLGIVIATARDQQARERAQIDSLREVERVRKHQIDSLDQRVKDLKVALIKARKVTNVPQGVLVADLDSLFGNARNSSKSSIPNQ
jgi:hypothetical protein